MITQTPSHVPPPPVKSTPTSNPDKIRPISKSSMRASGITPIQSPSKSSSIASSMNSEVPQIEINSPSPNSPGVTSTNTMKSKNGNRDPHTQHFGYDAYIKQPEESTPQIKSPSPQRKPAKASTAISPIKQRDHSDSRRGTATPLNGNPTMNKNRMPPPRHTSTSSDEQHVVPPTPMKNIRLNEQPPPPPSTNNQFINKTNHPPRLFIALFDYDPNAMSPNKDNEEELPFKEGQLIRVRSNYSIFFLSKIALFRSMVIKMLMDFISVKQKMVERVLFQAIWYPRFNLMMQKSKLIYLLEH